MESHHDYFAIGPLNIFDDSVLLMGNFALKVAPSLVKVCLCLLFEKNAFSPFFHCKRRTKFFSFQVLSVIPVRIDFIIRWTYVLGTKLCKWTF